MNIVRVVARSREDIPSDLDFLSAHALPGSFHDIISQADVVCCTCMSAGDYRLREYHFKSLLVDEASQATEPEVLIPLTKGIQHCILVGDHAQLPPTILNRSVAKAGLNVSLFERLVSNGLKPKMLQVQYRMHPCLSEFPSNMFYEGQLQNGVNKQLRYSNVFPWPTELPLLFYHVMGQEEMSGTGLSYLNRAEVSAIHKLSDYLKVEASQLGIVTPYEGQRAYLVDYLMSRSKWDMDQLEVASVDAFQGLSLIHI